VYKTRLTPKANKDIDEADQWRFVQAPEAADRWLLGLLDAIEDLRTLPHRCPLAREGRDLGRPDLRQSIYEKYRILFVIQDRTIAVLHVRHGNRNSAEAKDLGT